MMLIGGRWIDDKWDDRFIRYTFNRYYKYVGYNQKNN